MVKLDVSLLRYLSVDEFRVLTAVEMGMKNHEIVPVSLVATISSLRSGVSKILHQLCRHKLVSYESGKRFDGYRLTYKGYDYLALNVLRNRNVVCEIGSQIGVGKESDVFLATNENGERVVLKIHRLGRVCFRKVNDKRDYEKNGKKIHSFLYMSRLAAKREFAFLEALHKADFPVPKAIDCNRHCVVMGLIEGSLLNNLSCEDIKDVPSLYDKLMDLIISLANDCGVVHGDINEFNIMINNDDDPILFDFPQMVAVNHNFAEEYFSRDVNCIVEFFKKRCNYVSDYVPNLTNDVKVDEHKMKTVLDLENTDLENIDLENTDLENTDLENTDLENIDLDTQISDAECGANELAEEKLSQVFESVHIASEFNTFTENISSSTIDDCSSVENDRTTSICSSFASEDVRRKLRSEREKKTKKSQTKNATRRVKGAANVTRRERNNNVQRIKDDCNLHKLEGF